MKKWMGLPLASMFALQAVGSGEAQTFTDDAYTVTAAFHVTGHIQPAKSKRTDYSFYSIRAANAAGDAVQCAGLQIKSPKHLWAAATDPVLASMMAPTDGNPASFGGCVHIGPDEGLSFQNPAISLYDAGKKIGAIAMPVWTAAPSSIDANAVPFDLSAGTGCRAGWQDSMAVKREGDVLSGFSFCPRL